MGKIQEAIQWYENLDYVDRQNFWMAVAGGIVVLLALYYTANALDVVGGILGDGADYAKETVSNVNNTIQ